MRRPRFPTLHDPVVLLCGLAWLIPVVVAVARAIAGDWYPVSDQALIAIRARDVLTADHPLLGTAASAALGEGVLTNHPGPLIFDVAALPVRLFGSGAGLAVAIASINLVAGWVAIVAAARQAGRGGAVAITAGLGILVWSAGNAILIEPYNPTACVVPFLAVMVLAWATVGGDRSALPWLVGFGSFCLQTNLAYLVTTVPIVLGALGVYVWRRRRQRPWRDLARRCAPVLLILWAQPVIEQLVHVTDGNVARLARAAGSLQDPLGLADGTRQAASVLSQWPGWTRGHFDGNFVISPFVPPPSLWWAALSLLTLVGGLVALAVVSRRWLGDPRLAALLVVTASCVLLGWIGAVRVPLSPFYGFLPHFVRWLWPIGVLTSVAVGLFAARALQRVALRRTSPAFGAVALVAAVAIAVPDGPPSIGDREWNTGRPVARELNAAALDRLPASGVTVDFRRSGYPSFTFALVAALHDRDIPFAVLDDISLRQFGDRRAADPDDGPVVHVAVGVEALDVWDEALACASALDDDRRHRLDAARVALASALARPGFTLSDTGAQFAASGFGAPWMVQVPAGLPPGEAATIADSPELAVFLADGLIIPPASLVGTTTELVELRRHLEDNTACVVVQP